MTGTDLANRLLKNIQTSLELRSRIPYLDMLRDLVQGGTSVSTNILNTSSNFGSFDTALKESLTVLHNSNSTFMAPPANLPLPLTAIHNNLNTNMAILIEIFQDHIDNKESAFLLYKLDTINQASV